MRIIDADALLNNYKGNILTAQTDYAQGARDIMDDIRNAPTVDAVPMFMINGYIIYGRKQENNDD